MAAFTCLLFGLGVMQFLLQRRLATDTRESMDIARESAAAAKAVADAHQRSLDLHQAELRAYVTLESAHLSTEYMSGPWEAHIALTNGGQTPARNVVLRWDVVLRDFPLVGDLDVLAAPQESDGATLGAGGRVSATKVIDIVGEEFRRVTAGELAIFVFGWVTYDDLTDVQRTTDFRFYLGGDHGVPSGLALAAHPKGNRAT